MLQSVLELIYPPQCLSCDATIAEPGGLCGACWGGLTLAVDPFCDLCGLPLPGPADAAEGRLLCDECLEDGRPWLTGRTAFVYEGTGRRLVLALKHGDRTDLARPLGAWMARAGRDIVPDGAVLVPIPLHWRRRVGRRYNQAALLADAVGAALGVPSAPEALRRTRATRPLDGHTRAQRRAALLDAISPGAGSETLLSGRPVVLIDDVMTSGATFEAAALAVHKAGAASVRVLSLARVPRGPYF